jgi:hypothetical protein
LLAKTLESVGDITGAVIGQDLFYPDAQLLEPEDGSAEKSHSRLFALVRENFDIGQSRGIVDTHMDKLPSHSPSSTPFISGDAMPQASNLAQFFDVQVQQLPRMVALVATSGLCRLQALQASPSGLLEDPGHGGTGQTQTSGNLGCHHSTTAKTVDCLSIPPRNLPGNPSGSGRPVFQTRSALGLITSQPLVDGPLTDPQRLSHLLDRLSLLFHSLDDQFSTSWAGSGIVVDVHSGSPFGADGLIFQLALPKRLGWTTPFTEQPVKSSQLGGCAAERITSSPW